MTDRPRLLFLDQFGTMGGGQRVLLSLVRAAEQEFAEVSVLAPAGPLEDAVRIQSTGRVYYHRCEEPKLTHGSKGLADILALCAYSWRFRKHFPLMVKQQVIYVNGIRHLPLMLVFALLANVRVIYHAHLAFSRLERWLIRLASRWPRTYRLVVNSQFIAQHLDAGKRVCIIRNALDPSFAVQNFVDRFGPADWHIAVIGTLRPEKGQDLAMNAVENRPRTTLHLVGRNGEGSASWIATLKARQMPNVIFEGAVDDVVEHLKKMKIMVSLVPSRCQEAFGLIAIESMACSCLTIVSGSGGLAEIAADTGAIVAKDEAEIGAALDRLRAMPAGALAELALGQFEATQRIYAPERFEREIRELLRAARDL